MPTMSHDAVWPHSRGQSWFADWYFILPRNQLLTNVPLEHERWAFKDIRGPVMTTVSHDCGHTRKQAHIHLNQVEHALIMPTDSIRTDEKLLLNLEPLEGWGVCVCVCGIQREDIGGPVAEVKQIGQETCRQWDDLACIHTLETYVALKPLIHRVIICRVQNIWRFLAKQQKVLPCWCVGTVSHSSEYTPHIL